MKTQNFKKHILIFGILIFSLYSFTKITTSTTYKCMIQMKNYTGEGAYIVISLLKDGEYIETLRVQGDDDEWYSDITEWWKFQGKVRTDIDAVTGATIGGGNRTISLLKIDPAKINSGYRIRFESAVEDQEYYKNDIEFDLTSENIKNKIEGKGFIRYIRLMPQ
ncbi:DUF2271 domain-containing protein [Tenacibaculum halocynthiae]|uniref:DUF2271 domain-containing protein n=1 Tax=Tenacibaculum halocynthiae TaxID=1254437 RepID=UPI0026368BF7|nr:DUF2271 domain-containing protein [uncultured Tenacibaculum sp.]